MLIVGTAFSLKNMHLMCLMNALFFAVDRFIKEKQIVFSGEK